jgi:hypothetical protein
MNASDELIKAFEGIGYIREKVAILNSYKDVSTQQLQEWLYNEKGLWVNVQMSMTRIPQLQHTVGKFFWVVGRADGRKELADSGDGIKILTPHEALSDGLLKAVEICKERK